LERFVGGKRVLRVTDYWLTFHRLDSPFKDSKKESRRKVADGGAKGPRKSAIARLFRVIGKKPSSSRSRPAYASFSLDVKTNVEGDGKWRRELWEGAVHGTQTNKPHKGAAWPFRIQAHQRTARKRTSRRLIEGCPKGINVGEHCWCRLRLSTGGGAKLKSASYYRHLRSLRKTAGGLRSGKRVAYNKKLQEKALLG